MQTKTRLKPIFAVIGIVALIALLIGGYVLGKGEQAMEAQREAPVATPDRLSVVNGLTTLTLPAAVQAQSGIQVAPVAATSHIRETVAYGTAIDLQPLIDLRTRYASAQADAETARAAAQASKAEYDRNKVLYQDNRNVSLKVMQAAQAIHAADQARVALAKANADNLQAAARQQFGALLGRWAFDANAQQFQSLLTRQEVLLRITLPLNDTAAAPAAIEIGAGDNRRAAATLIGPSPQSDPALQGRSFFYRTAAALSVGTRVEAFLSVSGQSGQGLLIPQAAIVWYGGQPWAYVQADPTHFQRRPVSQQFPADGGYVATGGFQPGERVVIAGAQLLLSEESRAAAQGGGGAKEND